VLLIHRSERADPLVAALGEVLARPTGDPFAPEVVAVPSRGVERWLAQQLSHVLGARAGDGVCANVLFPSSTQVLDDAAAAAHAEYAASVEAWSAERAVWPLVQIIDDVARRESWATVLAVHLGLDASGHDKGRRFAVAAKLARHFDSYGRSRPELLRGWRDGRTDGLPADLVWQAELWRALRAELGPSPAELLDDACAALRAAPARVDLPDRFSVFGATRVSPARVAVLDALADGRDLHLWLHHPSPALWTAVKGAAAGPGRRQDDAGALLVANPLLASLSRDIRELQQLLPSTPADQHHPIATRPDTVLGRLQGDLADDRAPAAPALVDAGDRSLSVHACHGPARQVEVMREAVLGLLAADPTLEPRDILIMCPDIEAFAPLVAAAFGLGDEGGSHPAGQLRVRLADRSLRQTNPLLGLLSQLLELGAYRVTATQVLDLAGLAAVRRRFGFTDDDVEQLRDWTTAANARWGLDAAHRDPYGLGGVMQGTWRVAIDRLLLGAAMEEGDRWIGDVLPLDDVDSGDIDLAGRFAELLDRVDAAVRALEQTRTVPGWMELLVDLVLGLGEPEHAWQAAQLASELGDVAESAGGTDIRLTRADVTALLAGRLAGRPTRASFRTGTLTVCTLVPMRSVPHRVVGLLGMDDGAFPRHGVVDGDDVLARDPRTGERDVRSEDRQLFLDAVCAAQEQLVITYTGADPRTGVDVPPCVPLGELLDAVDASARTATGSGREHVVVHHPLQPFDARNFTAGALGAERPFSFDPGALAGARAAIGERHPVPALIGRALPGRPAESAVDLDQLVRFLQHPARGFLKQRLDISTWDDDGDPSDALAVDLDNLELWAVGDRVLRNRLAGHSTETCAAIEHRRGELPPGQLGRRLLAGVGATVDALLAACERERAIPPRTFDVSIALDGGRRLEGTVGGLRGTTLLALTYSSFGAKQRLEAWVRYLALVASSGDIGFQSLSIGRVRDGAGGSRLRGVAPEDARGLLAELVALRDAGLRAPLPMAIKTSETYADERFRRRDVDRALQRAEWRWNDGKFPGERSDAAHKLVHGGVVPLDALTAAAPEPGEQWRDETTRFGVLACRLWTPVFETEVPA
jgi:exodeoxyribonuclease V gamma subunit